MDSNDFLEQHAGETLEFSSQYGSEDGNSYTAVNILGKPSIYPEYGDCSRSFVMRTYGKWWNSTQTKEKYSPTSCVVESEDFIEVKFLVSVYPQEICIYETYNPGSVVKIFAFCNKNYCWSQLWSGRPQITSPVTRIFAPQIKKINFSTNRIRLEFNHQHLAYYTEIDAVVLIGIPEAVNLENKEKSQDGYSSNDDCKDLVDRVHSLSLDPKVYDKKECDRQSTSDYFSVLPIELIRYIVSFLDFVSLCQASSVSRLFRRICYDSSFFSTLNLKNFWHKVTSKTLIGLNGGSRCLSLTSLDISWCGRHGSISPSIFIKFIINCGRNLSCLRVSGCHFFTDVVMRTVVDSCHQLKELDLHSCIQSTLTQTGFALIAELKMLERLNLYRTRIKDEATIAITSKCLLLENINLGSCIFVTNMDDVANSIASNLRNLRCVDFWRSKTLRQNSVQNIAVNCPNLAEIDIGWCIQLASVQNFVGNFVRYATNLTRLSLTAIRNTCDEDLRTISSRCKNLRFLDILGSRNVTPQGLHWFLSECSNLKFVDVSFCQFIDYGTVLSCKQLFTSVEIKKSSQQSNDISL